MMNKITYAHCKGKRCSKAKWRKIARHKLEEIIETFNTKSILPDVHFNKSMIRMCTFRKETLIFQPAGGQLSPMFDVDPQLVAIIVNMRKTHQRILNFPSLNMSMILRQNGPAVLVSLMEPPCGKLVIRKSKTDRTKLRQHRLKKN